MGTIFPALGYCAYCRATDKLSDEHIIPYSLGGSSVIPKASCSDCAQITSVFELKLARNMYAKLPSRSNAPSRKKKLLKEAPAQLVDVNGTVHNLSVPADAWHFTIPLITLPTPTAFDDPPVRSDKIGEFSVDFRDYGPENDSFWRKQPEGKITFRDQLIDFNSFYRLLAKIAHCAALAELGDRFEPWLTPYILGRDDTLSYLIGGNGTWSKHEGRHAFVVYDAVLGLKNFEDTPLVICEINLFSNLGTPNYTIIVGPSRSNLLISEKFSLQIQGIFA